MNTIGNDESDNKKPDNKKPDNEISDNEKSNNGNTADDYKDGAVTKNALQVITIIGEIEGHDNLPATSKATKYEHMLPKLAEIEMDKDIKGVLFIMNTVGGDVSAGLALAEMIASMKKPTVSLIIGDSHSIGVPLAVSTDYSFIVPTATMILHPVRMNGTLIGVQQTYDYFERISDRITSFIADHSRVSKERVEEMMVDTTQLSKDLGTVLVGRQAVEEGLKCEVGGISDALAKLDSLIDK